MSPYSTYRKFLPKLSRAARLPFMIFLALASLPHAVGQSVIQGDLVPLLGHRSAAAASAQPIGRIASAAPIALTLALAPRDPQGLDTLLHRLYDPSDPLYGKYLTPQQFTARFSPTPDQYAAVAAFARAQGLTVTATTPNRLLLSVTAPSATVEAAFGVHLIRFQNTDGHLFHAPDAEPVVPVAIASLLTGVIGLDDNAVWRPRISPQIELDTLLGETGSGPNNALSPSDIKTAYGLSNTSLDGTGQTLALFELDGYTPLDITKYEQYFNLYNTPLPSTTYLTPTNVLVDNVTNTPGGGADEVTLDIELMLALAPRASNLLVYEGPNTGSGLLDTYNKIATDDLAPQISTSWGLAEGDVPFSYLNAENTVFAELAAQGQAIYAASGDSGADDNGSTLSVDDPASQPFVTGVGGTSLTTAGPGGAYQSETTWVHGGGGVSAIWNIPYWQAGVSSAASNTLRNVPDVSFDADPNTGFAVYFNNGWTIFGGTSCAAPVWAAFTALVNQQRALNGHAALGFANPILYAIGTGLYGNYAADFNDIADNSTNGYYHAIPGYDNATGWGTFKGLTLLNDLATAPLAPAAPTGLSATAGNGQASLTWNPSVGATNYLVLRGTVHGGPYTPISTVTGATTYTDTGLTNGTTYYYVVMAGNKNGVSGHSNEASVTPLVQVNASAFVSQSVPATMAVGQGYPVAVTFQNTGTTTWTAGASYHLGSQAPPDNTLWLGSSNRVSLPGPVAPGQSVTFSFTVTAPASPGTYPFQWRMVQDGVQWFGPPAPLAAVSVTAQQFTPGNASAFVSQSVPATMVAGQSYPVSVTFQNTGTTTWTSAAAYHLGSQYPQDNTTWGLGRVLLPASVAPGQSVTFSFTVTAPAAPGAYPFQWRMVQDGVQWFGDFTPAVSVSVTAQQFTPGNASAFVSQSVPATMVAGQSYPVAVTFQNTGTTTWTSAAAYHLGSQAPPDNTLWLGSSNRVSLPGPVAPGQSVTVSFTVTAPASPGTYPFQWRMVQDGVQWFGDFTPVAAVSVTSG